MVLTGTHVDVMPGDTAIRVRFESSGGITTLSVEVLHVQKHKIKYVLLKPSKNDSFTHITFNDLLLTHPHLLECRSLGRQE